MLILETHSTSDDNEAGLASGWYDVGLSSLGEQQARELGERRAGDRVATVYCSDLLRSYRTGDIAFGARGVPVVRDERLRECDYGVMTRRSVNEVEALRVQCIDRPFPGGESYSDVVRRIAAWRDEVRPAHGDATVVVIGHRATFYAFEHLFNGRPLHEVIAAPWTWQPGWQYRW